MLEDELIPAIQPKELDKDFVARIEAAHFRTDCDTGANENAMAIWNCVRKHVGLPRLHKSELPSYCLTHRAYHVIREDYGCKRQPERIPIIEAIK
jgi:hypothetical protein